MKRFIAIFMTLCLVLGLSSVSVWATEEASWQVETPIPTARSNAASCVVGNDIYVIGGTSAGAVNTVEIYNTKTKTWSTGPALPTTRNGVTACVVGDKIYVIGGSQGTYPSGKVEIYDTKTKTWSTGASMPTPRTAFIAASVGDKIYAIGGYGGYGLEDLDRVEIYYTNNDTWGTGRAMPTGRTNLSAAVFNSTIYAIGGYRSDFLNNIEVYETSANDWFKFPAGMSTGKQHVGTAVVDGKIYMIGGQESSGLSSTVDVYEPNAGKGYKGPSLPKARALFTTAVVNGKIYVIGGSEGAGSLNTVESLQVGTPQTDPPQSDTPKLAVLLNPAETVQLSTSYNLANNLNYTWSSTNEAVATVDKNGKVTAVAVGTADVYAQNADGSFKQFIPVRVTDAADELRLAVHLKTGEKAKLYLADDASKVTWKSLDETVATVSTGGQVTGVKQGLVILQGELDGKSYQIYVRVNG